MKKQDIIDLRRKRAGNYDVTANRYYLIGIFITRPFGARRDLTDRKSWEPISKHLTNTTMAELYGGFSALPLDNETREQPRHDGFPLQTHPCL